MSNYASELQQTVFNALDQSSTLQNLVTDVYDFVPESTAFPYVKIGEQTMVDDGTKDKKGSDFTIEVHTFSRYRGSVEIKNIMSVVYDILHESSLSVSGASLVNMRFEFSDIIKENDGLTTHGVQRFRVFVLSS
jgi:hypothetical protein|tara:strand:+ start:165 stop:566 length:402 start_codon:yes stop_codon:yes gene_type:complete